MKLVVAALFILASTVLIGCDSGPQSARGFSLPDGNIEKGKETFVNLECNACHTVTDVEAYEHVGEPPINVTLGGEVTRIKTYGELVTSIINPSHRVAKGYPLDSIQTKDGQSKMVSYNDVMKVGELIDLVAFLQSKYELVPYDMTNYPAYEMF